MRVLSQRPSPVRSLGLHLCLVGLCACVTSHDRADHPVTGHPISGVHPDGTPKWVQKGSGVYEEDQGKAFYGVGIANGIRNLSLLRQTADNRARGEIAKMFDLYVAAMMKDYQASTTAGDFQSSAEEQDVVSVQQTITETALRGVEIRDHWRDPADDSEWSLAVLRLDAMMQSINNAKALNAQVRDHVRANAQRAFTELDGALETRRNR